MDILLYKDGHLAVSESPLQGKENNLDDVVMLVTNPQDGDTLTYKNGKWVNGEGGGGSFAPDITNPQDGDTLVYNATAGKWVNGSGGGGGAMLLHVSATPGAGGSTIYMLDKTWNEIKDALAEGTQMLLYGEGKGGYAGVYAQYAVGGVMLQDGSYLVITGNIYGDRYEDAVLGVENPFAANSEDGYPSVVYNDK